MQREEKVGRVEREILREFEGKREEKQSHGKRAESRDRVTER